MEITEKIKEMIMSDDVELHFLVTTIIGDSTSFEFKVQGTTSTVNLANRYNKLAVREILRHHIKRAELMKAINNK